MGDLIWTGLGVVLDILSMLFCVGIAVLVVMFTWAMIAPEPDAFYRMMSNLYRWRAWFTGDTGQVESGEEPKPTGADDKPTLTISEIANDTSAKE